MSAVVEESDADFRKHVLALNEQVKRARDEYAAAKDIALARKKRFDELNAKMSTFIDDYGKPNPQPKLNFGNDDDDDDNDLDLGNDPAPVAGIVPFKAKDESPSIETLDIPAKLVQLLMDNGIETVNQFIDLVECKNSKFPQGPESIDGCGKKACKQLAKVYEDAKYGDTASYEPPLPEEAPPGMPVAVSVDKGGEVISSSVGETEEVEAIEDDTENEAEDDVEVSEPAEPTGEVKIRSKTTIEGALEMGQVYNATVTDGEACVEINGDPIMLMEGEYELVS